MVKKHSNTFVDNGLINFNKNHNTTVILRQFINVLCYTYNIRTTNTLNETSQKKNILHQNT